MKVFLNPGHAPGIDPGACGYGKQEALVVREICTLLEAYLELDGIEVVGNVQDDSLSYIVREANRSGADVLVSVHCNSAKTDLARGTETFVYAPNTKSSRIAKYVNDAIVHEMGTWDRGVRYANYYVLVESSMPAILVECAFINNYEDNQLLDDVEGFAQAIARGLREYRDDNE